MDRIADHWIFFAMCLMPLMANGQISPGDCSQVVDGVVYSIDTGEPLPYVTVSVSGSTRGTVTDENGQFRIENLCGKEFDIVFSYVGYKTLTHHHDYFEKNHQIFLAADELMLQSIVVHGDPLAPVLSSGTYSEIKKEDLAWINGSTLGDVLKNITGVSSLSTGQNIVKPMIHGLHSNRVLIINNGIRHEFQNWGAEHAPEIDPSMADNIEVLKGAASVRYGPEALGGVVLINPPELDLYTDLSGDIGVKTASNGRAFNVNGQLQKGWRRFSLMGNGSYYNQGDLRAPDYHLRNTGRNEYSIGLGGLYHIGSTDFETYYSHFEQDLGILRGSITGSLEDLALAIENEPPAYSGNFERSMDNPRQQVSHDLLKLKGKIGTSAQSININFAYQANKRKEFDVRRGTNNDVPSIDLILKTQTLDADWEHPDLGLLNGTIGVQSQIQQNRNQPGTNTTTFIPNYNSFQIGIFAIEKITIGSTTYEAGLRYDHLYQSIAGREPDNEVFLDKLYFQNITATVGLTKKLSGSGTIHTNIGSAWRPPNISELYSFGKHSASIEYGMWRYARDEQNNVVIPEKVLTQETRPVNSEMGIKWTGSLEQRTDKYDTEITAFVNYIQDYIYAKPAGITNSVRGAFPFYAYDQDNALLWGLDVTGTLKHNDWISSTFKGSYLWARDVTNNDFFVEMPPPEISYIGTADLFKQKFSHSQFTVVFQYVFRQNRAPRVISVEDLIEAEKNGLNIFAQDDSNFDILAAPDGYLITNLEWNASKGPVGWSVKIRNLFNTRYRIYTDRLRYFADEPGINLQLGISYRL